MYTLMITRGYPTKKYKTYGIFEFDQAKALLEEGQKVIYAAIDLRSIRRKRKWGIHKKEVEGIQVYEINIPLGNVPKTIFRFFNDLGLRLLYKRIVKDYGRPDILHAHFRESAYIGSRLKDRTGIPLVVTEHSSRINKKNIDREFYSIAKIAYEKTNALIVVSPSLGEMIEGNFNISSIYIPNIVDLNTFKYKPKADREYFRFVSTGNLIKLKRMDLIIEAFAKLFKGMADIRLDIFGDGPERKNLKNLIEEYDLSEQISLRGVCGREEIASTLENSDCFVLPSQTETFGVAYIEAIAMGVPVIATRCGGPEVFVNDRNGILIDIDDLDELIEAMNYMYENIKKYDGENIALEINKKFSSETVARQIIDVYKDVLS